jgi:MFS family permease
MSPKTKTPELNSAQPKPAVLPYAWVILAVVYFASVAAPFNQFKVPPIMPELIAGFNIDLTQAGLLMSIIAVIGLVLALPAGILLQRYGPKLTGLIALACLAGGSAFGALSGSFGMLLVGRVIEGFGVGLISVVAPAVIAMWFPPERQGGPMGIWATWVPVGTVVMYLAAPALIISSGWQSVWWLGAAFAAFMFVVYAVLIRRPPNADVTGSETPSLGPELRKALANRNIWLLALMFACFNMVFVSQGSYYPTFLNTVREFSLGQAALIASLGTIVVLASAPLAGWLSDKIGSRRLFFSLPFLIFAVLFLFPYTVTGVWIPILMVLQGIFAGTVPTATFATAPEVMKRPQWAGFGLSAILIGQNIGQLLGPLLFGEAVKNLGWAGAGYLLIPICLVGFISGWMVKIR